MGGVAPAAGRRTVLLTGASAGIGRACATRLAAAGWAVWGASRRGTVHADWPSLTLNVDDDASVAEGVAEVVGRAGRLDAVVACAGWGLAGPVEHTEVSAAKDQFETNFFGAARLVKEGLPHLRVNRGRVVLIGSIGGMIGIPFQAFYSASKFALEGYAEALAYEVAPLGIEVTVVEPGNVRTDFTANRREAQAPDGEDPYEAASRRALEVMARDEANGVAPESVATCVERVLASAHPPRRVSVGRASERVGILAKRILPNRIFERAAKGALGV